MKGCRPAVNDLLRHLAVNTLTALGLYACCRSLSLSLLVFLCGFLIDLDHLIDYFLYYRTKWDLAAFVRGDYARYSRKLYLFLHSWELTAALCLIGMYSRNAVVLSIATGFTGHLIVDQYRTKFGYFLLFRIAKNFDLDAIFESGIQQKLWENPLEEK